MTRFKFTILIHLLLLLTFLTDSFTSVGQVVDTIDDKVVYVFQIHQEIAKPAAQLTNKAFDKADKIHADVIILDLDTYGGAVDAADEIRTRILKSKIKTIAFVRNNAASAGALISIACDSIYMAPGSTIGAATVVNGGSGEQAPDKYQSYMRKKMRATAEEKGRDPDIAEAMVDASIEIEGISAEGKVITFSVDEAIVNGFCEAKLESVESVIERLKIEDYKRVNHQISSMDKFMGLINSPFLSGLLVMLIVGGIYFELQTPGIGFPLMVSLLAGTVYFVGNYLGGNAELWEVMIFLVGVVCIVLELFVIPGFGVAGIAGIFLTITGLTLALIGNVQFDFEPVDAGDTMQALITVLSAVIVSLVGFTFFGLSLTNTAAFKRLSLQTSTSTKDGYTSARSEFDTFINQTATTLTDLRPAGKVLIDGRSIDAVSDDGFIEKNQTVKVIGRKGNSVLIGLIRES